PLRFLLPGPLPGPANVPARPGRAGRAATAAIPPHTRATGGPARRPRPPRPLATGQLAPPPAAPGNPPTPATHSSRERVPSLAILRKVFPQQLPQTAQGPQLASVDRSFTEIKDLRNLPGRQLLQVTQHQHLAVPLGQPGQRVPHALLHLLTLQAGAGTAA